MVKPVIRRSYDEIDKIFEDRETIIRRDFSERLSLTRDTIEQLFYLDDLIRKRVFKKAKDTSTEIGGPKALILFLNGRNNYYLIATYNLALRGLSNPSLSLQRSVFETILQLYLLHLTDREAELFFKSEIKKLTKEERKEFKNKYKYLKLSKILEILYTEQTREIIKDFYSDVSKSTHPSIFSVQSTFEYHDDVAEDTLRGVLGLSLMHLIVISEIYYDELKKGEVREIEVLTQKILQELQGIPILIPDNPVYADRLRIKFPSSI